VKLTNRISTCFCLGAFCLATIAYAQGAPTPGGSAAPQQQGQGRNWGGQNGQRPVFGKITAIRDGAIEIAGPDGQAITVKVTGQTEFRKDREPAKITDFKVGDTIFVRGDQNPDHTVTAQMVGARIGGGPGGAGPGGRGPGGGGAAFLANGTFGKDYVMGEVKAIDPPRLTVLRTDNVTQTLELNEDTTLRRGRDSITMADIQVGDHVMVHGAAQNDVFVPKGLMVMNAEQWKRMQEFAAQQANGSKPASSEAPAKQ
jgi:hypothetical protein